MALPALTVMGGAPPDEAHAAHAQQPHVAQNHQGQSILGDWLIQQEQIVGDDPHYVAPIEPPPPAPHHQHHQFGYPPEQPQYTLEAVPPLPQYMPASYQYAPPPPHPAHAQLPPPHPPSSSVGLHGPPGPHHEELVELRRSYAAAALAPQTELSQLGLAANGSRVNETWMSFMHQHSGMLNGGGGGGRHM
jgi:hypothetical protein